VRNPTPSGPGDTPTNVPDPPSRGQCYEFGPFVADLKRRQLWLEHATVPLNSKTLEVLFVLIEHRHKVLEKDELLRLVWPDAIVQESNLARQVSMLRHALGERRDQHDYVVTVPGRGYQFVADVRELANCPDRSAAADGPQTPSPDLLPPTPRREPDPAEPPVEEPPAPGIPPELPTQSSWWRHPLAIASLSLVAIAAVVVVSQQVSRRATPQRQLRQASFESGLPREPAWSPDGQRLVYTSDRAGSADIWMQSFSDPDPMRLTFSDTKEWQPDWSPDGTQIAFRSERDGGGIYVVAATGGEPRRISDSGFRPRWSPDGSLILLSQESVRTGTRGLSVVTPDGKTRRPVLTALVEAFTAQSPGASIHAAWHPDGRRISVWGRHPISGWSFVTAPIDAGPQVRSVVSEEVGRQIEAAAVTLGSFVWARSGRALYFEGVAQQTRNAWRVDVEPDTIAWLRGPERLTTSTSQDGDIAISPDGTKLAFTVRASQTRMWSLPLDPQGQAVTGAGEPVTSGDGDELDADAPVDGSQIAYRALRGARQEMRTHSFTSGKDRLLLASDTLRRSSPRWSPDGKRLAYAVSRVASGSRAEQFAIGVLPAFGGAERQYETQPDTYFKPTDWSRTGDVILGSCRDRGARTIATCQFTLPTETTTGSRLEIIASSHTMNLFCQRFSPDQQWISFVAVAANDPTAIRIYVQPSAGGAWRPITDGTSYVDKARWSPDGRAVYYISDQGGFLNVWGQHFDSALGQAVGTPFRVTSFAGEQRAIPAEFGPIELAVASKRLFIPLRDSSTKIWILDNVDR
jgi:eukaryotic-like serine/threonine-protein kinase